MSRSSPGKLPRETVLILLFDLLWCLGLIWVWGVPAVAAGAILRFAGLTIGWWALFLALPVAYLVFLLGASLAAGVLRLVLPRPRQGISPVFVGRAFAAFLCSWGLEAYFPRPLITHIQLLTLIRWVHGRCMGMKLHWSTHISPGTELHSYPLLAFGRFTYLGEGTGITAHLSRGDKLLQAPVIFGDHCSVGARTNIGPGCRFGDGVKIGALVDFAPGIEVEDDVEIEPRCQIGMGVRIGKGAYVEARSFLPIYMTIPAGERWGGDPVRKLGDVVPRDARGRRRRSLDGERPSDDGERPTFDGESEGGV